MKNNKEKSQDEFKVLIKINNNPYFSQRNFSKNKWLQSRKIKLLFKIFN